MNQSQNEQSNPQSKKSMTTWLVILVVVIVVVLVIAGYYFYKIGTEEDSKQIQSSAINTEGLDNLNVKTKSAAPVTTTTQTSTDPTANWQDYFNSRFGYQVKTPKDMEKFESQNGDGATFSKDSPAISIGVWGAHNTENLTATQYLDKEFSTLQMETPDVKEIGWSDVDMDGCDGERRTWQYSPATGGGQDIEEQAICVKDGIEYGIYMTLSANDYETYSEVFDNILFSFKFGN